MFKENWLKIWDLATMRGVDVGEGFDEFLQSVRYNIPIEGVDFDFNAAHEEWKKLTDSEQNEIIEEYLRYTRGGYTVRVKEYKKHLESKNK